MFSSFFFLVLGFWKKKVIFWKKVVLGPVPQSKTSIIGPSPGQEWPPLARDDKTPKPRPDPSRERTRTKTGLVSTNFCQPQLPPHPLRQQQRLPHATTASSHCHNSSRGCWPAAASKYLARPASKIPVAAAAPVPNAEQGVGCSRGRAGRGVSDENLYAATAVAIPRHAQAGCTDC